MEMLMISLFKTNIQCREMIQLVLTFVFVCELEIQFKNLGY